MAHNKKLVASHVKIPFTYGINMYKPPMKMDYHPLSWKEIWWLKHLEPKAEWWAADPFANLFVHVDDPVSLIDRLGKTLMD